MLTIIPLIVIFIAPILMLAAAGRKLQSVIDNKTRLDAKYRLQANAEAERRECVNFIVSHESSIRYREPYAIISKKLDGKDVTLDECMLRVREKALAYAKRRIREIGKELGDNAYGMYARES